MKLKIPINLSIVLFLMVATSGCGGLATLLKGEDQSATIDPVSTQADPEEESETVDSSSGETTAAASKADVFRQMNCREPSETDYLYGTYQIGWAAQGIRHEGILRVEGDVGKMRIKFFNAGINAEDVVDQDMFLATCPQGLILLGENPRTPDTEDLHATYAADNILIRQETNGSFTLMVVDDNGVTAPLEIQQIEE